MKTGVSMLPFLVSMRPVRAEQLSSRLIWVKNISAFLFWCFRLLLHFLQFLHENLVVFQLQRLGEKFNQLLIDLRGFGVILQVDIAVA
jgi:multisubunit Na+/H+ antiporter MnhB subunit